MAQAWASLAVLTAGSQAAPKIPTSCRRSSDRSQTVVQLPACLAPQFEPHVVPSRRVPRLSSLALTRIRQRLLGCRIFTPAQPSHSAASSEGFLLRRLHLVGLGPSCCAAYSRLLALSWRAGNSAPASAFFRADLICSS